MPKSFQEILPALEERLEQAKQGALPHGHAMELRRREKRQAMGCPSDEEIGGFVDGELRGTSAKRWAEVRWHMRQCQHCQDDVEWLCEALEVDLRDVIVASKPARQRFLRLVAPIAAAAVLVLAVLGVRAYVPALAGWSTGINEISAVESPVKAPALVNRQRVAEPEVTADESSSPTMKVSIPVASSANVSSVLRVAICSETKRPICGEGMELMSVMGAACQVVIFHN